MLIQAAVAALLSFQLSPFGRKQGLPSLLPDDANRQMGRSNSVEVVISLCESLRRKTNPTNGLDWKPEIYTTFLSELRTLGWSYHFYDHENCSSAKRHAEIKTALGSQHYTLLPNKGKTLLHHTVLNQNTCRPRVRIFFKAHLG